MEKSKEAREFDRMMMRLGMAGVFHGVSVHARNIFEYYVQHGNAPAKINAHAGLALLALVTVGAEAAMKIIDLLDDQSPEVLCIRALIYKTAKSGRADEMLAQMEKIGGDVAEFAEEVRRID